MLCPLQLTGLVAGRNTLGRRWKLVTASSLKAEQLEKLQALRAMQDAELTRSSWLGLSKVASGCGAMNDIVEAMDIDGQLFVSAHNLPEFIERASERGAEQEYLRIMEIIQGRIDIHSRFVEFCMENDARVTPSIFSSLMELRSLLRKIQE